MKEGLKMKKIIALLLATVVSLSAFVLPASAATKADLIEAASAAAAYKYVKASLENAARSIEVTEAQADQLLPLVQEAAALFPVDKGPTLHEYGQDTVDAFLDLVDQACAIINYSWTFDGKTNAIHSGDGILRVYDASGKLVYEYDGDYVTDTSGTPSNSTWVVLSIGALISLVAGAAFVIARKKVTE